MDGELLSGWPPESAEQFKEIYQRNAEGIPDFLAERIVKTASNLRKQFQERPSEFIEDYFFTYGLESLLKTVVVLAENVGYDESLLVVFTNLLMARAEDDLTIPHFISVGEAQYEYVNQLRYPPQYIDAPEDVSLDTLVTLLDRGQKIIVSHGESIYGDSIPGKKRINEVSIKKIHNFVTLTRELRELLYALQHSDYSHDEKTSFYVTVSKGLVCSPVWSPAHFSIVRLLIESGEVDTLDHVLELAKHKQSDPSFDVFVANLKYKGASVRLIDVDDDAAVLRFLGTLNKSADFSHVALQKGGQRYDLPDVLSPIYTRAYRERRLIESSIEDTLATAGIIIGRDYQLKERLKTPASTAFKLLLTQRMPYKERSGDKIDDTIGIRMLGRNEEMCRRIYTVLGLAYEVMVVNDFLGIEKQKPNHYRSLDFYLRVNDRPIHLQARTEEMEQVNEYGSASHYAMKNNQMGEFQNKFREHPDVFVDFFKRLAASLITGFEKAQKEQLGSLSYRGILDLYRV